MSLESPVSVLYDDFGVALAVSESQSITGSQPGLVVVGSGSTGWRYFHLSDSGAVFVTGSLSFDTNTVLNVSISNQPTVLVGNFPATQSVLVSAWQPIVTASTREIGAGNTVVSSWNSSTTSGLLFPANSSRRGTMFYMDGNNQCFIKLGPGASNSSFTVRLTNNSFWEMSDKFTGSVSAIFNNTNGALRITEILD